MDENNLNKAVAGNLASEPTKEVVQESAGTDGTLKAGKEKKPKKTKKTGEEKIHNRAIWKKGGYSVALIAIVIAAAIVLNILVGALSDRFVLEFDMSSEKKNSISQENIDYVKKVDDDIDIIVCAAEDQYSSYMGYYAQQYSVSDDNAVDYYDQSLKLLEKYHAYNKKLNLQFVDVQSTEFSAIASEYSSLSLSYGDVIVSRKMENGTRRTKKVGYTDIYELQDDSASSYYGTTTYTVSGNNLETAVTSAIAYVTSDKSKTAALVTGHSSADMTQTLSQTLSINNYEIVQVSDKVLSEIPDNVDLVIIPGASTDFIDSELELLSAFLDDDGKLGKGMMVFADSSAPYLTNFYSFLKQWGIEVKDGILFETDEANHMADSPTTLGSYSTGSSTLTKDMNVCITGKNVPLAVAYESADYMKVGTLFQTPETTVLAPRGTAETWTGANAGEGKAYPTVIQSTKSSYDKDDKEIESFLTVFSSVEFLESDYIESNGVSNKNLTLAVAECSVGADNTGISFVSKSITNESFSDSVTEKSVRIIRIIFMGIIPVLVLAAGIFVYIRRRNA